MEETLLRSKSSFELEDVLSLILSAEMLDLSQPTKAIADTKGDITKFLPNVIKSGLSSEYISETKNQLFQNLCDDIEATLKIASDVLNIEDGKTSYEKLSNEEKLKLKETANTFEGVSSKKRVRRKPEELERTSKCPYVDCNRIYSSNASLKLHIKRNHKENDVLRPIVEIVKQAIKIKKGVDINNIFNASQVEKLHSTTYAYSSTKDTSDQSSITNVGVFKNSIALSSTNIFDEKSFNKIEEFSVRTQQSSDEYDSENPYSNTFASILKEFENNKTLLDGNLDLELFSNNNSNMIGFDNLFDYEDQFYNHLMLDTSTINEGIDLRSKPKDLNLSITIPNLLKDIQDDDCFNHINNFFDHRFFIKDGQDCFLEKNIIDHNDYYEVISPIRTQKINLASFDEPIISGVEL